MNDVSVQKSNQHLATEVNVEGNYCNVGDITFRFSSCISSIKSWSYKGKKLELGKHGIVRVN